MAKDRFYRTKPHVNGGGMIQLQQLGFSALGVHQIRHQQVITDPQDRGLVAEILMETVSRRGVPTFADLHINK